MKTDISFNPEVIKAALRNYAKPVAAHSNFIVWMVVFAILLYAFFVISSVLAINDDADYRNEQMTTRISSSFDKATIDKVNNLKPSDDPSAVDLPAGRRNPFTN